MKQQTKFVGFSLVSAVLVLATVELLSAGAWQLFVACLVVVDVVGGIVAARKLNPPPPGCAHARALTETQVLGTRGCFYLCLICVMIHVAWRGAAGGSRPRR